MHEAQTAIGVSCHRTSNGTHTRFLFCSFCEIASRNSVTALHASGHPRFCHFCDSFIPTQQRLFVRNLMPNGQWCGSRFACECLCVCACVFVFVYVCLCVCFCVCVRFGLGPSPRICRPSHFCRQCLGPHIPCSQNLLPATILHQLNNKRQ